MVTRWLNMPEDKPDQCSAELRSTLYGMLVDQTSSRHHFTAADVAIFWAKVYPWLAEQGMTPDDTSRPCLPTRYKTCAASTIGQSIKTGRHGEIADNALAILSQGGDDVRNVEVDGDELPKVSLFY